MWGVFMGVSNLIKYRSYIDWTYSYKSWIPALPGCILGSLLIVSVDSSLIELIFAGFVIAYVLYKFYKLNQKKRMKKVRQRFVNSSTNLSIQPPNESQLQKESDDLGNFNRLNSLPPHIFYPGYFSFTFLGGLIAAAGPINIMLLEKRGFEKEEFIANFSATTIPFTFISLGIYLVNGMFSMDFMWLWLLGFPIIYVATKLGYYITANTSVKRFKLLVFIMLIFISLKMLISSAFVLF